MNDLNFNEEFTQSFTRFTYTAPDSNTNSTVR